MKKITSLFVLFLITQYTVLGQAPSLNDFTWHVYSIEANGNTTLEPQNPNLTSRTVFNLNSGILSVDLCCGGSFQMDIAVNSNNSTFTSSNFSSNSGDCNSTENSDFSSQLRSFFQSSSSQNFTYSIVQENNLVVKLEVQDASGEKIILYNTPHTKKGSKLLEQSNYSYEWHLYSMKVNGNYYSPQSSNSEYGKITATFNYDGSFITSVCDTLTAHFTLGNSPISKFFFNCATVHSGSSPCNDPQNTTFQDIYFGFFIDHSQDMMDLTFIPIDGQTGPCYAEPFKIRAPNGDYLAFINCSSLSTETETFENLKLYPNPATNFVFLKTAESVQIDNIILFDTSGKRFKTLRHPTEKINVSDLAPGIYFMKIVAQGRTSVRRIIKE